MGGGLLHDAAGNGCVDEGKASPLPVYGHHNAHMADSAHSPLLAEEHKITLLKVRIGFHGPSLTELDLGVCRYVIPEVLVYVTRETGAVKGLWASRAKFVRHTLEGTGIFHNIIPRHNLDGRDGFLLNFLGIDAERCGQKEEKQCQKVCPESFHTMQM